MLTEVCSHCNNTVAGQFSPSNTRKWLTAIAKKGGMKAVLAAVGSAVPVIGNIGGFLTGTAIDLIYGKDIEKFIDKIADEFDDNKIYVFECPQCGHSWTRKEDEIGLYDSEDYEDDDEDDDEVDSLSGTLRERKFDESSDLLTRTINDKLEELEKCYQEATQYGIVISNQFREKAQYGVELAHDWIKFLITKLEEAEKANNEDEENRILNFISAFEEAGVKFLQYIGTNCKGTWRDRVTYTKEGLEKEFSMQVFGVYELFHSKNVMLVGSVETGSIVPNQKIKIEEDEVVPVVRIMMFGNECDKAKNGDVCAIIVPKSYVDEDGDEYDLEFPDNVFMISAASDSKGSGKTDLTEKEEEYISEYKSFIEEDPVISDRERRLLNRISKSLGITEARAKELEALCEKIELTEEEQEYADEIKACLEGDGIISDRERRLLNRLRLSLEISEDRAREIEDSLK